MGKASVDAMQPYHDERPMQSKCIEGPLEMSISRKRPENE
jgi:hypothetical protein